METLVRLQRMSVIYDYFYESAVGHFLVATYNDELCSVQLQRETGATFLDMESEMHRLLCKSVPSNISIKQGHIKQCIGIYVGDVLAGRIKDPPFPNCFLKATHFQKTVWRAIWEIPYGQASTYGEVAEAIGNPKAFRAVANACGANPMAVIIPCHRVLPKDASIQTKEVGKYKWGKSMKLKLLEKELT